MARFLQKVLASLDRTYRFDSALRATDQVELGLPIQLVHDVSREASRGLAAMGFFISGNDDVHGGAGTIESSWNPYDEVTAMYGAATSQDLLVWLVDCWGAVSSDVLTNAELSVGYVPWTEMIVRRDRIIRRWNGSAGIYDQNVAPATLARGLVMLAAEQVNPTLPTPIFPGSTMRQQTVMSGAGTVRIEGLFWVGAIGTVPPGA